VKPEVHSQGKAIIERCGECTPCRIEGQNLACSNMLMMFPDGQVESAATDQVALDKIRAWFKANASGTKFNVGLIEWRAGTGFSVFKGRKHEPVACVRLRGWHLRFATKSWSDAFECPTCKTRKRYNLNFLGRHTIMCDGTKFTKVER
jgi:hypothetical protein